METVPSEAKAGEPVSFFNTCFAAAMVITGGAQEFALCGRKRAVRRC